MHVFYFLLALIAGFIICDIVTHPERRLRRKGGRIRIGPVQIYPTLRISIRRRTIWFHHWFNFLVLLIISTFFVSGGILGYTVVKGFLAGGVLQGLTRYPDRRNFFSREQEALAREARIIRKKRLP